MLKFLVSLLFAAVGATNLFQCDLDDYYGDFDPRDYSDPRELKRAVHDLIDDHKIIPYGECDEAMEVLDANPNGPGVIGIYSLKPKHPFPDEWNREHAWPRSRGVGDSGPDTSDLFHLYPTDMNLNSARGNKFFDECTPGKNDCESPAGTSTEDAAPGSSEDRDVWAPPPSMRGDLARAIFYMAVRYDGTDSPDLRIKECSTDSTCGSNSFGRLSTLLRWHREDPVSATELKRVNGICRDYQGNRNPFVDFPDLAERLATVFDQPAVTTTQTLVLYDFQSAFVVYTVLLGLCVTFYYAVKRRKSKAVAEKEEAKEVRAASL